jgi:DNA-binding NtrC family response regulator
MGHLGTGAEPMLDRVVVLEPPDRDFARLRRAFQEAAGSACEVRSVRSVEQLIGEAADETCELLVAIPQIIDDKPSYGLDLIGRLRDINADVPVVVVADRGDVQAAARAIEAGANDFLVHGERLNERITTLLGKLRGLLKAIDRNRLLAERNAQLRETIQARFDIVGQSPQIRGLIDQIRRVSQVPRPTLIVGERGTGKELVARAIHFTGSPSTKPIVTVNCAAFNEALLESELFGHEKGAFTGADTTRRGKFEQADDGTLFLDEIGNMSTAFQQKILRVVEYGAFSRVGGTSELKTNARIIAATNCDLREKIRQGEFLPDLYDRLAFEVLEVPPLRRRRGDIEVLAHHFLNQFAREIPAFGGKRLSKSAISALNRYPFPGNVRELKNVIERAAYRDTTDEITPGDLGLLSDDDLLRGSGTFHEKVNAFSRKLIEEALRESGGNQAAAARKLGLSYHQFRYYHRKLS